MAHQDRRLGSIAELWCALFEKGETPLVVKRVIPMAAIDISTEQLRLAGDRVFLTADHSATAVFDDKNEISWDIRMQPDAEMGPIVHLPYRCMYTKWLPNKKILVPYPRSIWSGTIWVNGRALSVDGWIGYLNHNWGKAHAAIYGNGNCNLFPTRPGLLVDGFSARLPLGTCQSPWLSAAIVRLDGTDYEFNRLLEAWRAKVRVEFPLWSLDIRGKNRRLLWKQEGDPQEFAGLRYHNPDGKMSYAYNTKFARTEIEMWQDDKPILSSRSDCGELEFLFSRPLANQYLYDG